MSRPIYYIYILFLAWREGREVRFQGATRCLERAKRPRLHSLFANYTSGTAQRSLFLLIHVRKNTRSCEAGQPNHRTAILRGDRYAKDSSETDAEACCKRVEVGCFGHYFRKSRQSLLICWSILSPAAIFLQ